MKNSIHLSAVLFLIGICLILSAGCVKNARKGNVLMSGSTTGSAVEKKMTYGPVYFDYNKTVLTPESMSCLYNLGAFLINNPGYRLIIEGYADDKDSQYDKYLSEERAKGVYNWLVLYGAYHIDAKRVEIRTYGSEKPALKNCGTDTSCHAKNRRVELEVIK